jgi:ribonuclease HI
MEKVIIYTDGGSRGNPGPSGIGVFIANEKNEPIKRYSQYLGDNCTNNEAEYQAVILALKKIKALFGKNKIKELDIEIRADSELLVSQLNGEYKILDSKIQSLFILVWNLKIDFKKIKFVFVGREKNKEAHNLAEEALNEKFYSQKLF